MKAAILGAGGFGRGHALRLRAAGAEPVCVCGAGPGALARFTAEPGLEKVRQYTDFDTMLAENEVQVLAICLPPYAHSGQLEKAAAKGIHIFIEKPIALDTGRGRSMVAAAEAAGIVTGVGFHLRQALPVRRLAADIAAGRAGRPVLFTGQYRCNSLHTPWWPDKTKSGGQVLEQAIHLYDLCRLLMGDPLRVAGQAANLCHGGPPGYTAEDVSACLAQLRGGALAAITATNCAVENRWLEGCTAVFENETVVFESGRKAVFTDNRTGDEETLEETGDVYQAEIDEFLACVRAGRPTGCPVAEGLKSLRFVEAVVQSAERDGAWTEI